MKVKFQGQFNLEGQGQGHQFLNPSETFRCSISSSSSWKVKFKMVQCLTVKIKFWKFEGQFDFEVQGQGHRFFLTHPRPLYDQYIWFKFEGKIQNAFQKLTQILNSE